MFSVGEIAIFVTDGLYGDEWLYRHNKSEVEIASTLYPDGYYKVKSLDDGDVFYCEPICLRKKPPYDGNVKSTWSDLIVWKPKEVVTV